MKVASLHLPLIDHWSLIIVNSLKIDNCELIIVAAGDVL